MAEFKHLVRIVNTDLDGNKKIGNTLTKVKGVGFMFASAALKTLGISPGEKTGDMEDADIKRIEEFLLDPLKSGTPAWLLNRRKDYETGKDLHLTATDVHYIRDNDIKRLKKIKAYRGRRHMSGLPVRGQRTKSNFRRNKGKVSLGVKTKGGKPGRP